MQPDLLELESLFLALGDKTRLRLLALMADGPVAVGLLAEQLNESQPKVSRHLAYLRNAGVVSTERDGKYIYYRIETPTDERVNYVLDSVIDSLRNGKPPSVKQRPARARPAEPLPDVYVESDVSEDEAPDDYVVREEREELEIFLL